MAKNDEISSTEKLLNLIRGKSGSDLESSDTSSPQPPTSSLMPSFSKAFFFKKTVTIGIEIGYNALRLAKIVRFSEKKQELLDYLRVPFAPDISQDSPKFSQFLKSSLAGFCGTLHKFEIWCTISSARVEIRYLRIPKVSKKQIANAVYWTYQKQVPFDKKKEIFDFEILGEIREGGAIKIGVIAYTVPRHEVEALKKAFSKSGYPLTGMSIVPFAIQNLLKTHWIETDAKNVCSLFIGRDWSRIAILSGGNLVLTRGIKAGIKSMIEAIREEMHASREESSMELTDMEDSVIEGALDEKSQIETDQARKIFSGLIHDDSFVTDINEKKIEFNFKEEEIFQMVLPALERLIRQVDRTFEHYSINFDNESMDKIYISGQIIAYNRVIDHISDQLGLPVDSMNPFHDGQHFQNELLIPESKLEREAFVPAVGIALSNNSITPNFIFTYENKEKPKIIRRTTGIVFTVFLFFIAVCIGISFQQGRLSDMRKNQIAQLQQQLETFQPQVDQNMILRLVVQTNNNKQALKGYARKYLGLTVMGEIANITPSHIRLYSITAELGGVFGNKNKSKKKILILDGIVSGDRLTFEPFLAGYLMKLKNSPIFSQPKIIKKSFEIFEDEEVLRFTTQLELTETLIEQK